MYVAFLSLKLTISAMRYVFVRATRSNYDAISLLLRDLRAAKGSTVIFSSRTMSRRSSTGSVRDADDDYDDAEEDGDIENVDESFLNEIGSPQKTPFKKAAKHFVFLLKGSL
jgi:hypothetical protein